MISLRHITGLEEKPCLVWWGRNTEFREGVVRAARGMGTVSWSCLGHWRVSSGTQGNQCQGQSRELESERFVVVILVSEVVGHM